MSSKAGQRRARFTLVVTAISLLTATQAARAATTYRAIDLTPIGSAVVSAMAAGGGKQVGTDDTTHTAVLWSSSAASAVNLGPVGSSAASAADATSQGGRVAGHAALWYGSASSLVDLHPLSGYRSSIVLGIGNAQQAGTAVPAAAGAPEHAALWSGAANTFIDLHPTSGLYSSSEARGTNGVQQVGIGTVGDPANGPTFDHALLWSGSPDTAVELLPSGAGFVNSAAMAIAGDVKVGYAKITATHAMLWAGPQNQFTDINPAWAINSALYATNGAQHAGVVDVGVGPTHAAVWLGPTPADAVDLQAVLPTQYVSSQAWGIDTNGDVVGAAFDGTSVHAFLWTPVTPEPTALPFLAFTTVTLLRRHRPHPIHSCPID